MQCRQRHPGELRQLRGVLADAPVHVQRSGPAGASEARASPQLQRPWLLAHPLHRRRRPRSRHPRRRTVLRHRAARASHSGPLQICHSANTVYPKSIPDFLYPGINLRLILGVLGWFFPCFFYFLVFGSFTDDGCAFSFRDIYVYCVPHFFLLRSSHPVTV